MALSDCTTPLEPNTSDESLFTSFQNLKDKIAHAATEANKSLNEAFAKLRKTPSTARLGEVDPNDPSSIIQDVRSRLTSALENTNATSLDLFQEWLSLNEIQGLTSEANGVKANGIGTVSKSSFAQIGQEFLKQNDPSLLKYFQILDDSIKKNCSNTAFSGNVSRGEITSIINYSLNDFEQSYSNEKTLNKKQQTVLLTTTATLRNMTNIIAVSLEAVVNKEIEIMNHDVPTSPNGRLTDFWDWIGGLISNVLQVLAWGFSFLFVIIFIGLLGEETFITALLLAAGAIGIYILIAALIIAGFVVLAFVLYELYCWIFGC